MNREGFTIRQLALALLIVLIVVAILFPAFTIRPNIKETIRSRLTWRNAISHYVISKGVYQCPDRNDRSDDPDGYARSYAANYTGDYSGTKSDEGDGAFAGPGAKPVSLTDLSDPNSMITLCEVTRHSGPDYNIDNLAVFDPNNPFLWAGHGGGGNYAFADGHVHWLKPLDTQTEWHHDSSIPLSPRAVAMLTKAEQRSGK